MAVDHHLQLRPGPDGFRGDRGLRCGDRPDDDPHPPRACPAAAVPARHSAQDDGGAAKARTRCPGAAQEVQERPAAVEPGDDEAVPGAWDQSAWGIVWLPASGRPDADLERALFRVQVPGAVAAHADAFPFRSEPQRHPDRTRDIRALWPPDTVDRLPDLPAAGGAHHAGANQDDADAAAAEPDRAGAADAPDAADDGVHLAADDRLLRADGTRRAGPLLVCRKLRQYHSAEFRRRVGKPVAVAFPDGRRRSSDSAA